tara:strand:+ start:73361 stop:74110 length:750 start_codon:yes stop_codon:yes gene_type:complete
MIKLVNPGSILYIRRRLGISRRVFWVVSVPESQAMMFIAILATLIILNALTLRFVAGCSAKAESPIAEPDFQWLDIDEVPQRILSKTDDVRQRFTKAGFRTIGFALVKHRLLSMYEISFELDGTVIGNHSRYAMFGFPMGSATAIQSLLEDGKLLETSTRDELPKSAAFVNESKMLKVKMAGTEDISQLLNAHRELVREHRSSENPPIQITRELIPELNAYGLNLADHLLHKNGDLPQKPVVLYPSVAE